MLGELTHLVVRMVTSSWGSIVQLLYGLIGAASLLATQAPFLFGFALFSLTVLLWGSLALIAYATLCRRKEPMRRLVALIMAWRGTGRRDPEGAIDERSNGS